MFTLNVNLGHIYIKRSKILVEGPWIDKKLKTELDNILESSFSLKSISDPIRRKTRGTYKTL